MKGRTFSLALAVGILLASCNYTSQIFQTIQDVTARQAIVPKYSVTYDGNGQTSGTAPMDTNEYAQGELVTASGFGSLVKTSFSFTAWNTQPNGGGTEYLIGATFAMGAADVTLYAQWTANPTYLVHYSANGGSGTVPANNYYEQGDTVTVATKGSLSRSGYTFNGWNTAANGSGSSYSPGNTFAMPAAPVTLYAQWNLIPTYSVTYNANGSGSGSVPVDGSAYQQGQTVTVLGNTGNLVGTGYSVIFDGWNSLANGSGTSYSPGSTLSMPAGGITLYAQYRDYTIGDTGPAGGIIFYDDENDGDSIDTMPGARYLEVAPYSTEWSSKIWGNSFDVTGAADRSVGSGLANTAAMYSASASPPDSAGYLAYFLSYGGYTDWYLPAEKTLLALSNAYATYGAATLGTFSAGNYWSSSQYSQTGAYARYVTLVAGAGQTKDTANYVRAVRKF